MRSTSPVGALNRVVSPDHPAAVTFRRAVERERSRRVGERALALAAREAAGLYAPRVFTSGDAIEMLLEHELRENERNMFDAQQARVREVAAATARAVRSSLRRPLPARALRLLEGVRTAVRLVARARRRGVVDDVRPAVSLAISTLTSAPSAPPSCPVMNRLTGAATS